MGRRAGEAGAAGAAGGRGGFGALKTLHFHGHALEILKHFISRGWGEPLRQVRAGKGWGSGAGAAGAARAARAAIGHALEPLKHFISRSGVGGAPRTVKWGWRGGRGQQGQHSGMHWTPENTSFPG